MINPAEPPKLEVYLLGAPELRRNDELWMTALSAKAQALLYYLLVTQKPQSRIALATLLWSEHADPLARASLRKVLGELRAKFAAYLQLDDDLVSLRPNAPLTVDANTFAALSAADAPDRDSYTRAVECYPGEFLAGFAVRNAPNFDAWLRASRATLQAALLRCLDWLLEQHAARGDLPQAMALGEQILAEQPWREATHRRLMDLLAESGQRGQALRQYERCRAALRAELEVEPAEATRLLYERLVQLEPAAAREQDHFTTRPDYALVGRRAEWRTLLAAWRAAADRNPHLALISGEAGIGKTRLAEELLVWAERQGIASAHTRSYAAGSLAYTPLIDWLRSRALQPARDA
jgi:DNA-binding SARP family transcriptional activator